MWILGLALLIGGGVQWLVAMVGYVAALRGPGDDAIATGTLFDGRWIFGSFAIFGGAALAWHWKWTMAVALVFVAYLATLPTTAALRLLFARA